MATEQLPADTYVIGGQLTLTGYILPTNSYGYEEDMEYKYTSTGRFNCKITYGRRPTLSVQLEVLASATPTFQAGGEIASCVFVNGSGDATAWKIKSATLTKTRGPQIVALELAAQTDMLA